MSLLQKTVDAMAAIDGLNGVATALQRLIDAEGQLETAAAASQLLAELMLVGAVTATVRTSMSTVRLGLAISGQIWKWEAISWAAGAATGTTAGALIDWVNDQHLGAELFDYLHPDPLTNTSWSAARTQPRRDPLAIDLDGDGDGIETVGIPASGNPVLFDHDADGVKTGTGWVKADDAWLVLDRDGNGTIDSGRELFGVDTMITVTETLPGATQPTTYARAARTGFEALRTLDTGNGTAGSAGYGDGIFNASDAAFSQVRLWQDLNQDGISQAGELFTLADKGITGISLNDTTASTNLGNGNTVTGQATVTRSNGSTTQIDSIDLSASNLNLADNPFYREFSDVIPLTAQAAALPEMGGSGWLRDLREAMSLGSGAAATLAQQVADFAAANTRDGQMAQLDWLIDAWAQTTGRVDTFWLRPVTATVIADDGASREPWPAAHLISLADSRAALATGALCRSSSRGAIPCLAGE